MHIISHKRSLMHRTRIHLLYSFLTFSNKSSAVAEMGFRLATIDMGRKVGGDALPLSVGEAGTPSNTMSPRPRPTSVPNGNLIHPTVWSQNTNVR